MSYKELVSVILTTYNWKNVVKRAVFSAVEQSYRNWELIIVDDGSIDGIATALMSLLETVKLKGALNNTISKVTNSTEQIFHAYICNLSVLA